ncbi:MAG: ATP-binding protein [Planctomycetota bacterium]
MGAFLVSTFFYLSTLTGIFPLHYTHTGVKFTLDLSPWYISQLISTAAILAYMLGELTVRFLLLRRGLKRTQIGWFLGAVFITAVLAFSNPLAAAGFGTYPMGGLALAFLSSILAYLVIKHRFLDVQLVLRRTFFWVLWTSAVAGAYALLLAGFGLFMDVRPIQAQYPNLVAILLAAFLLFPLRNAVQNVVDRKFFRKRYDARRTLEEVSGKLVSILSVEDLCREVLETVARTFQVDGAHLFLTSPRREGLGKAGEILPGQEFRYWREKERDRFLPGGPWATKPMQIEPGKSDTLPTEIPAPVRDALLETRIEASLPLKALVGMQGVLLLGGKQSEMAYTEEDLGFLQTVANQAAVALANAQLYEDVLAMKNYNEDILKSMDSGLITVDREGHLVTVNRSARQILGMEGDPAGETLDRFLRGGERFRQVVEEVLEGGDGTSGEEVTMNGRRITLCAMPLRDHRGEPMGAVASFLDVTEKARMKEALEQSQRLALLGEMASRVAHEIKNPLASLKLLTDSLERRLGDAPFRRTFQKVVPSEIQRLDTILQGLLDYARPIQLIRVSADLTGIVRASVGTLGAEIEERGVALEMKLPADSQPVWIDGETVKQVIINLIRNALQAMENSAEKILRLTVREGPSDTVELRVADTGEGIPSEHREKLFHPFFSTKTNGSGLGLAVSRKIVQAHGGEISVESGSHKGAVFQVSLPVAKGA